MVNSSSTDWGIRGGRGKSVAKKQPNAEPRNFNQGKWENVLFLPCSAIIRQALHAAHLKHRNNRRFHWWREKHTLKGSYGLIEAPARQRRSWLLEPCKGQASVSSPFHLNWKNRSDSQRCINMNAVTGSISKCSNTLRLNELSLLVRLRHIPRLLARRQRGSLEWLVWCCHRYILY